MAVTWMLAGPARMASKLGKWWQPFTLALDADARRESAAAAAPSPRDPTVLGGSLRWALGGSRERT